MSTEFFVKLGGLAKRGARPPGYPFQVRPTHNPRTWGFPLLSLAEAPAKLIKL
ncbi:MAG: hypothetical protein ACKVOQ_03015 [Cyclobacteriaceae bacterium]